MSIEITKLFSEIEDELKKANIKLLENEVVQLDVLEAKVEELVSCFSNLDSVESGKHRDKLRQISEETKKIRDIVAAQMLDIQKSIADMNKRQKADNSYFRAINDN